MNPVEDTYRERATRPSTSPTCRRISLVPEHVSGRRTISCPWKWRWSERPWRKRYCSGVLSEVLPRPEKTPRADDDQTIQRSVVDPWHRRKLIADWPAAARWRQSAPWWASAMLKRRCRRHTWAPENWGAKCDQQQGNQPGSGSRRTSRSDWATMAVAGRSGRWPVPATAAMGTSPRRRGRRARSRSRIHSTRSSPLCRSAAPDCRSSNDRYSKPVARRAARWDRWIARNDRRCRAYRSANWRAGRTSKFDNARNARNSIVDRQRDTWWSRPTACRMASRAARPFERRRGPDRFGPDNVRNARNLVDDHPLHTWGNRCRTYPRPSHAGHRRFGSPHAHRSESDSAQSARNLTNDPPRTWRSRS